MNPNTSPSKKIAIIVLDQRTDRSLLKDIYSDEYDYVLFTQKAGLNTLDEESKKIFSEIVFFDKDINSEELANLVKPYLQKTSRDNIYLITSREVFISRVAEVHKLLSLPGILPHTIYPFKNKLAMKKIVSDSNIRVPWYMSFDKKRFRNDKPGYIKEIDTKIQSIVGYPVFAKPIDQEGAVGGLKINNYKELLSGHMKILMKYMNMR